MDVTPVIAAGAMVIDGYAPGLFRIAGRPVQGAVLVSAGQVLPAPVSSFSDLTAAHVAALLAGADRPEVLLIGCGAVQDSPPPKALREAARSAGVVLEMMATGAACRTWNVLLGEGRRVWALLFPV